jgi:hypothetical protein
MQVSAFSTPQCPDWRWRITNYACEVIEESHGVFPSIAVAIAEGTKRLKALNITDRSVPPPRYHRSIAPPPSR